MKSRLRRLDESANITVYEKGDYNSYANCGLPFFIGGVIPKVGFSSSTEGVGAKSPRVESEAVQGLLQYRCKNGT